MMYKQQAIAALMLYVSVSCASFSIQPTPEPLPEPLTLEYALSLLNEMTPDMQRQQADVMAAEAGLKDAQSLSGFNAYLEARARWVDPADIASDQSNEDHRLGLVAKKTLYDFGRSSSAENAASYTLSARQLQFADARRQRRLQIMQAYFAVVLADLQFYRYNEEMAVAYIQYDRMQIRHKLGQYTEVEVAEKEVEYQRIRRLRTHSQSQQRVTRALLAQSLNRPGNLPDTVAKPELDVVSRKLPEVELLQKEASEKNPLLAALRLKLAAAKNNVKYARASDNPVLSAGVNAYQYERETSSSNKWEANITLNVPLWSGNRVDAAVAKAKAESYKIESQLVQQEQLIQQRVLELWLNIETLKIKHEEMQTAMDFTELRLDKSRALYELEVTSDLGYSMVKFSEAERRLVQTNFEIALAWAQLDALSGKLLDNFSESQ